MRPSADYWIKKLGLTAHIEGGYFKEIYRSAFVLTKEQSSSPDKRARNIATGIYYLLMQGQFSAFHRIASDEQWHFYFGDPLIVYEITKNGECLEHLLGANPDNTESFHCVIAAGSWFAARPAKSSEYCLVGCTVAPGFEFDDFELADRHELIRQFPPYAELIHSLTRSSPKE